MTEALVLLLEPYQQLGMVNYCPGSDLLLLHKVNIRYFKVTEVTASVTIQLSKVSGR